MAAFTVVWRETPTKPNRNRRLRTQPLLVGCRGPAPLSRLPARAGGPAHLGRARGPGRRESKPRPSVSGAGGSVEGWPGEKLGAGNELRACQSAACPREQRWPRRPLLFAQGVVKGGSKQEDAWMTPFVKQFSGLGFSVSVFPSSPSPLSGGLRVCPDLILFVFLTNYL